MTYPMRTERAPSGVTKIGGAKVYAAKLATFEREMPCSSARLNTPDSGEHSLLTFAHDHCRVARRRELTLLLLVSELREVSHSKHALVDMPAHQIGF